MQGVEPTGLRGDAEGVEYPWIPGGDGCEGGDRWASGRRTADNREPGYCQRRSRFRGTRVPVESLIDNLEANVTLDEYLENFPTVSRQQALQVLELSRMTVRRLGCQN